MKRYYTFTGVQLQRSCVLGVHDLQHIDNRVTIINYSFKGIIRKTFATVTTIIKRSESNWLYTGVVREIRPNDVFRIKTIESNWKARGYGRNRWFSMCNYSPLRFVTFQLRVHCDSRSKIVASSPENLLGSYSKSPQIHATRGSNEIDLCNAKK